MIEVMSDDQGNQRIARIGRQPIALAAVALVLMLTGAGSIALWRATAGSSTEPDRVISARQIQLRAAEASEQLVERTKALAFSQQESIDQLQALQDQVQGVKRLLAAQQSDAKRLSDQLGAVAGAIDSLRQSYASAPATEPSSDQPNARHATNRPKLHATRGTQHRRAKSRG
jgi:septal ring factor EnvC (AmiA/AmiB activator)